jgi:predicted N-formylglutamate amidohydrolase
MALMKREKGLMAGDNESYSVTDASDYALRMHGEGRGLHHVAIEFRQGLIGDDKGGQRA